MTHQLRTRASRCRLAGRKGAETDRLAALLRDRAVSAVFRNPTRHDLVERIEELIAQYKGRIGNRSAWTPTTRE